MGGRMKLAGSWMKRLVVCSAAVALACVSFEAHASDDEVTRQRAIREFVTGNTAYAAGDFETAALHFERANEILPNPMLFEHIAVCRARVGRLSEAREILRSLVAREPQFEERVALLLEEFDTLARQQAFDEAVYLVGSALNITRGEQPRTRNEWQLSYGTRLVDAPVHIASNPRGAEIFIDDLEVASFGTTPLTTPLFTGPHLIEIRADGYETVQRMVNVTTPRTGRPPQEFHFDLERLGQSVSLRGLPTGRIVWIGPDGQTETFTEFPAETTLPIGVSAFLHQAPGIRERVEVDLADCADDSSDGVCVVSFVEESSIVEPELSELVVVVESRGSVYVDGQLQWQGPGTFSIDLSPGAHSVELRLDGHEDSRQEVTVNEAGRTRVSLELGPEQRRRRR